MVPGATSRVEHIGKAVALRSLPFDKAAALSESTLYATEEVVERGHLINDHRHAITKHLRRQTKQLRSLNETFVALMPAHVRALMAITNIAMVYLCILLRWGMSLMCLA